MLRLRDVLQAHTAPIRCITFTHSDKWLLSTDDSGLVRLWTPRLELAQVRDLHTGTADLSPVLLAGKTASAHAKRSLLSGARQHADKGHSPVHTCAVAEGARKSCGNALQSVVPGIWGCLLPEPCCQSHKALCHSVC